jgi:hypothetical protein
MFVASSASRISRRGVSPPSPLSTHPSKVCPPSVPSLLAPSLYIPNILLPLHLHHPVTPCANFKNTLGTFAQGCETGCGAVSVEASAVGGLLVVDDFEAQAVVDQLLHRHRRHRGARDPGSAARRRWVRGVLHRARNTDSGVVVGRERPPGRRADGFVRGATCRRRSRLTGGGALARRRSRPDWDAGSRVRCPRCARFRSDVRRTQERVADPRATRG